MHPGHHAPRPLLVALFGATLLALATPAARAQSWVESGDAGDLVATAQSTAGSGPLQSIAGTFLTPNDADIYCIQITDKNTFYAGIQCLSFADPDIWLFDSNGLGVAHNDICQAGLAEVTGSLVPANGVYYLAVAYGGRQAQSAGGAIWLTQLFTGQRAPDGPGAAGVLNGWAGTGNSTTLTSYSIYLGGAGFCSAATPTHAPSWGGLKILYR